jgi:hypothetical protein
MHMSGQYYAPAALPRKERRYLLKTVCVPEPIWLFWREEKSVAVADLNPGPPSLSVISTHYLLTTSKLQLTE